MRVVIAFLLVVAAVTAEGGVDRYFGYHDTVGIAEAAGIKSGEDQILTGSVESRIVGGAASAVTAQPYLAGLIIDLVNVTGNSVCGSSLLSANRLVTAAHCWFDGRRQAWRFTVVLGSQYLFSGGTRVPTTQVVMHPQWTPSLFANDIAMVYLPYNVAFTTEAHPIALPNNWELSEMFTGEWAVAAGYGKIDDIQTGVTTTMYRRHVSLQVISVTQCQATFVNHAKDSNICTNGAGGVGICGGDSGGPLTVIRNGQPILIGVSSFVADLGCQLGFPSAFARVTSYLSWIQQHLRN